VLQTRVQVLNDDLRETLCRLVPRNEVGGASGAKGSKEVPVPGLFRSPILGEKEKAYGGIYIVLGHTIGGGTRLSEFAALELPL